MNFNVTRVFEKYHSLFQEKKFRQIVLYGGSRSSKTYSLMQSMVIEMMRRRGLRITVWRNEKVTCRATAMEDFRSIIFSDVMLNSVFLENKAKGTFTHVRTGAVILFEGADSISKVLGLKQHISIFNEITEFNEKVYLQITQRTEETVFADYNPSKKFWFQRMKRRADTIFIHSNFLDNPYLAENIVLQLKSYEPWESDSYWIEKGVPVFRPTHGEFKGKVVKITKQLQPPPHKKNTEEKTANKYMWLVYGLGIGAERPEKIYHGWEYMPKAQYDALPYDEYYGLDFGTSKPTACVGVKYDGDRTFFIDEKIYIAMGNSSTTLPELLEMVGIGPKDFLVCDSAKMEAIRKLRKEGFKAIKAIKGQDSVNPGIEIVQMFNIILTQSSENVDDEQEGYSWELDRYNEPTDKPLKKDDHGMDAIRYIITYLYYYLKIELDRVKAA